MPGTRSARSDCHPATRSTVAAGVEVAAATVTAFDGPAAVGAGDGAVAHDGTTTARAIARTMARRDGIAEILRVRSIDGNQPADMLAAMPDPTTHIGSNLAPGVRLEALPELDAEAPMDVAERFRDLPGLVLLESARPGRNARWTYLSADPVALIETPSPGGDIFGSARRLLGRLAADPILDGAAPPFTGGLAGFLGYDLGRSLERLPSVAA